MKKLTILITVMLLAILSAKAQWAVYDASNFQQTLRLVKEAGDQSQNLKNAFSEIKKANEMLTKISRTLSNISLIGEIMQDQVNLVGRASSIVVNLKKLNSYNPRALSAYKNEVDNIIKKNASSVELLKSFLREGLSMSDGERMQLVMKVGDETEKREGELRAVESRAKSALEISKMYDQMSRQ